MPPCPKHVNSPLKPPPIFPKSQQSLSTNLKILTQKCFPDMGNSICGPSILKIGHRIPGLSSDEELELRHIYFLIPLKMLYSVLTSEEMSTLTTRATRALLKQNNLGKIFPVVQCMFSVNAKEMLDDEVAGESRGSQRYAKQRSWRPALETIVEYPR